MNDMVETKITNNPSIRISFVPPFSQTPPNNNFSGGPDRAFHFAPGVEVKSQAHLKTYLRPNGFIVPKNKIQYEHFTKHYTPEI